MMLLDQHRAMLHDGSGLPDEVIEARGYRTVSQAADLLNLGFAKRQCRTAQLPGLLIPIFGPDGLNGLFQYRPDNSRVTVQRNKPLLPDGTRPNKVIKYETPEGAQLRLDVPPLCRPLIGDVNTRLFITEGIKKADALAAHGACVIGLLGVWSWRDRRGPLPDWEYIALKGRQVVIVYDNDISTKAPVYQAMLRLKRFLESRGAIVRVIYLPKNDGEKLGVDDWLVQGHNLDDLLSLSSELKTPDLASRLNEAIQQSSNPDLPGIILTGAQLRDSVSAAITALVRWNHPATLFVRMGRVVRLVHTEREVPQVEDMPLAAMRVMLSQSANYFTANRDGKLRGVTVPRDVTEGVLNLGEWPFPPLLGVMECPQLRPDGSILHQPGYDALTRIIYAPLPDLSVGDVPSTPTAEDVRRAVDTLIEPFSEFPFKSDADKANYLGLLLTPIMRTAIDGPIPLALITATTPGTGKGILARAVIRITTGHDATFATWPEDETERRKFITSALRTGNEFVVWDNVSGTMQSDVLSQCLTVEVWQDRLLGGNTQIELPNRSIWIATGNNLSINGDLSRRCYRIALDAQLPRPWERSGFTHPDLIGHLAARRGELLNALLTLARAWYAADCPAGDVQPVGSFEEWTRTIGGILQHAGIGGFLGNRSDLYHDTDMQEWEAFLSAWYARYANKSQTLGDVVAALVDDAVFAATLPGDLQDTLTAYKTGSARVSPSRRLGRALKRVEGRLFGTNEQHYHAQKVRDSHSGVFNWFVVRGDSAGYAGFAGEEIPQTSLETVHQLEKVNASGVCNESGNDADSYPQTPHNQQSIEDDDVQIVEIGPFVIRGDEWVNTLPD